MPTDSIADIDATLAAPDIIAELQAEAKLCRQALVEVQAENARLERELAVLRTAAQEFVDKVDRGEARSVRSYASFKAALNGARQ